MISTSALYQSVVRNLPRMLAMTAAAPAVKNAVSYYAENIGKVKTADEFVGNFRLLSFALNAYGLSDQINSAALIKQVILGGTADPASLANKLSDPRWRNFAKAFDFSGQAPRAFADISAVQKTTADFVEQQLESDQGGQNTGVQLAMYFRRVAPTVTNGFSVLADKNLAQVVQTIFALPPGVNASNIDKQAAVIAALAPVSDLTDPTKLARLTERFTAMYDLNYGGGADSAVSGGTATGISAAAAILSGIVTSNNDVLSSIGRSGQNAGAVFGSDILASLQRQKLGGS